MRRSLQPAITLAAASLALAWGACTQDFDIFGTGQGGATTTTTTNGLGGGSSSSSSSSSTTSSSSTSSSSTTSSSTSSSSSTGGGPVCGNGAQEAPEQCDDGNTLPADGCSATCQTEDPDTCPGPSITLTTAGFTVTGDTTGAANDMGGAPCGGATSGDFVYSITAAQAGTVVATLTGNFATHLYARSACPGSNGSNLACSQSHGPATISVPVAAGESFYLIVDGYGGQPEEGPFTLTLSLN